MRKHSQVAKLATATFAFVALALSASASFSQDWTGKARVNGRVVDGNGEPLEGVTVSIYLPGKPGEGPPPFQTDKKGRWNYLGLQSGSFTALFEKEGYIGHETPLRANEFGGSAQIKTTLSVIPEEVLQQQAAGRANAFLDEANQLYEEQDYVGAREKLGHALAELDPAAHPQVLMAIARSHYSEGNFELAIDSLKQGLEIDPDHLASLKLVSNLLVGKGRQEEAEPYLARLPEGEGLDPDAYLNMGIDHYNGGDIPAALIQFDKTVSLYPENPEGYYYRALVHMSSGNNAQSLADFQKHLELSPDSPRAAEIEEFMGYLQP